MIISDHTVMGGRDLTIEWGINIETATYKELMDFKACF